MSPAAQPADQPRGDARAVARHRVVAAARPGDQRGGRRRRAPPAARGSGCRPERGRTAAGRRPTLDRVLRPPDLRDEPARARAARSCWGGCRCGSRRRARARGSRPPARDAPRRARPTQKNVAAAPGLLEQVQHRRRHLGVGPVVERQGHEPGPRASGGQPRDVGAEPAAAREHARGGDRQMVRDERGQRRGPRIAGTRAAPRGRRACRPALAARKAGWPPARAAGLSHRRRRDLRSAPLSSSSAARSILPRDVRGMASTMTTLRGTLCSASRGRHHAATSS